MAKLELDKYYTEDTLAQHCVDVVFSLLGSEWDRIIEPSSGAGAFLKYLPETTIDYDIAPELDRTIQMDYREVKLPHMERSLVIGNPPFGRANKLSVQFMIASLKHSDYVAFIQPISQLNQNRTMKNTELLYSEDLGKVAYSGRKVHCCFNIYHKSDKPQEDYKIEGIYSRHIFRSGKAQHSDEILDFPWDFRVQAWGNIHLLGENEFSDNEIVFRVDDEAKKSWLEKKLKECDFHSLLSCVSSPNLPVWRLNKWLFEEKQKEEL